MEYKWERDYSSSQRCGAMTALWILSGLYGCARPFDAVQPYRLEMGAEGPDDLKRFDMGFRFAPEFSNESGPRQTFVFMKR